MLGYNAHISAKITHGQPNIEVVMDKAAFHLESQPHSMATDTLQDRIDYDYTTSSVSSPLDKPHQSYRLTST